MGQARQSGERPDRRGTASAWALTAAASLLRTLPTRLTDTVMPPLCLACRAPLTAHDCLCPACWSSIEFIRPPYCDRLGLPMPYDTGGPMISAAAAAAPPPFGRARAVARYSGTMRELVHDLKFRDRHDVRRLFGRWLIEAGRDLLPSAEVIVPVPLSRWRLFRRQFNQAGILAAEIGNATGRPVEHMGLERTRRTAPQVGLTRGQRRDNVKGAFAVPQSRKSLILGRRVLLVDDVITTGATIGAATAALLADGAASVDVLALAMVTDVGAVPD